MTAMTSTSRAERSSTMLICFAVFAVGFVVSAIKPLFPRAWLLEQLPTVLALPIAISLARRRALSDRAWIQVAIFALLHFYGAHYTYANTPLGFALRDAFGFGRNHYDRIVHFASGLLLFRVARELAYPPRYRAGLVRELAVSWGLIAAVSLIYEQLEWLTAIVVDPAAGSAFLGTQGDEWDAQKDATAASIGGLIAMIPEVIEARRR
jgi:putative membrane protein